MITARISGRNIFTDLIIQRDLLERRMKASVNVTAREAANELKRVLSSGPRSGAIYFASRNRRIYRLLGCARQHQLHPPGYAARRLH